MHMAQDRHTRVVLSDVTECNFLDNGDGTGRTLPPVSPIRKLRSRSKAIFLDLLIKYFKPTSLINFFAVMHLKISWIRDLEYDVYNEILS